MGTWKVFFTVLGCVIVALILLFLDRNKRDSGVGWSLGKNDPLRKVVYGKDDRMRRFVKPMLIAWIVVGVALMWLFLPD